MLTASRFMPDGRLTTRMLRTRLKRTAALLVASTAVLTAIPGSAEGPAAVIADAAVGGAPAVNVTALGDLVSVYNFGPLQPAVSNAAISAAASAG